MKKILDVLSSRPWRALGVAALAGGIAISLNMVGGGVDFPVIYVMGQGWLNGTNVYLPEQTAAFRPEFGVDQYGMFYPPATGFVAMPLALLPYDVAKWAFALTITVAIVFGIRALVRVAKPEAPPQLWMIAAGVVLASSAMRWGMMLLQVAPLVLGLLCLFVSLLHRERPRAAVAVAIVAMSLKMTLALPFLGLLALRRHFVGATAVVAAWVTLNVIGFWRMGTGAFAHYQRNIGELEQLGHISTPDPWRPIALPRLDWVSLFYGITENLTFARTAALAVAGACFLWLAWCALRHPRPRDLRTTAVFLGAATCLGSLGVYHHQYDAILFFAPALLGVLLFDPKYRWGYLLVAPLIAMILLLPIGKTQAVLVNLLGLTGVGLLKLSFPVAFTLALAGCLLLIQVARKVQGIETTKPSYV
jgi:arabinofuranan 3-O-arabinosyltransferase